MSGYGKTVQSEYDSRSSQAHFNALQQAPYSSYSSPLHYAASTASSQAQALVARTATHAAPPPPHHGGFSTGSSFPRGFGEPPEIISFSPRQGVEGTSFTVTLKSTADLSTDARNFKIMFGSRRINSNLTKSASEKDVYHLNIEVPSSTTTGWVSAQTMVYLLTETEEGDELGTDEIGEFTYTDAQTQVEYPSARTGMRTRKRKSGMDDQQGMNKRPTTASGQPIRPKSEDFGTSGYSGYSTAGYSYGGNQASDKPYSLYSSYDHPGTAQSSYTAQSSPRNTGFHYQYPGHSDASPTTAHSWATVQPSAASSRALPSPDQIGPSLAPAPDTSPTPALIRTSTMQVGPGIAQPPANAALPPGFNPYSLPHKAMLKVKGDLGDMAKHWTEDEWESRRRLVQFWRQQKGNTIHTTFQPVDPADRDQHGICVSCIWWAEKNDCFVTSVDCIHLLESLIAVRFTVEEKNRIRRNLEGFRPLTVSKSKPDSEAFFKLIMAFPAPKPRNIEKDVKVFPWSVLQHALRKIISKYSASYSSTASLIPQNASTTAYPRRTPSISEPTQNPPSISRQGSLSSIKPMEPPKLNLPPSAGIKNPSHPPNISPTTPTTGRSSTESLPSLMSTASSWSQQQALPPAMACVLGSSWNSSYIDPTATSAPPQPTPYYPRALEVRETTPGNNQ